MVSHGAIVDNRRHRIVDKTKQSFPGARSSQMATNHTRQESHQMPVRLFGRVRSSVIVLAASFATGVSAEAQIPTGGHAISEAATDMPQLHHVGLNSKDPEAA